MCPIWWKYLVQEYSAVQYNIEENGRARIIFSIMKRQYMLPSLVRQGRQNVLRFS